MNGIVDYTHRPTGTVQGMSAAAMGGKGETERVNHPLWAIDITAQQSAAKAQRCAATKSPRRRVAHSMVLADSFRLTEPIATELFVEMQP
jgi:hypothetical protein